MEKEKRKTVSRLQWLDAGLAILENHAIEAVHIDRLAQRLGVSRSSFYFHFGNRNAFLRELLKHYRQVANLKVLHDPDFLKQPPLDRLHQVVDLVHALGLDRYEVALLHWAHQSETAASVRELVIEDRRQFCRHVLSELGFVDPEREARAVTMVTTVSMAGWLFPNKRGEELRAILHHQVDLLTQELRAQPGKAHGA